MSDEVSLRRMLMEVSMRNHIEKEETSEDRFRQFLRGKDHVGKN